MGKRKPKLKVGTPYPESVELVSQLDPFTRGYLVAALWSSNDNSNPDTGGDPIDQNYSLEHCTPGMLKGAISDCADFQQRCAPLLRDGYITERKRMMIGCNPIEYAGHDFWLTRNGHGAGFWDGDWVEPVGDMLADAAKKFGEVDLYITDSGHVHDE